MEGTTRYTYAFAVRTDAFHFIGEVNPSQPADPATPHPAEPRRRVTAAHRRGADRSGRRAAVPALYAADSAAMSSATAALAVARRRRADRHSGAALREPRPPRTVVTLTAGARPRPPPPSTPPNGGAGNPALARSLSGAPRWAATPQRRKHASWIAVDDSSRMAAVVAMAARARRRLRVRARAPAPRGAGGGRRRAGADVVVTDWKMPDMDGIELAPPAARARVRRCR